MNRRLAAIASSQFGPFTLQQAVDTGLCARAVSKRCAAGRMFRIHQGVYSLVPPRLLTPRGIRMAAVLACGDGAALSHLTAAVHTGFLRASPRLIDVTVPHRGGRSRRAGVRVHRSSTLRPSQDIQLVYGIPTTTVARTILDLLGVRSPAEVEEAMVEASRQEILDLDALREQVARSRGRREGRRLARLLADWDYIYSLTESELEMRFLKGLDAAGLPRPEPQHWIDPGDGGRRIRADFCYVKERLILETDGWVTHAGRFEYDTRRDQRAAAAGFRTLRITRRQVVRELDRVMGTVAFVYEECRAAASGRLAA